MVDMLDMIAVVVVVADDEVRLVVVELMEVESMESCRNWSEEEQNCSVGSDLHCIDCYALLAEIEVFDGCSLRRFEGRRISIDWSEDVECSSLADGWGREMGRSLDRVLVHAMTLQRADALPPEMESPNVVQLGVAMVLQLES